MKFSRGTQALIGNDRGRCSPFLEGAESIQEGRRRAPSGQRLSPSLNRETPELAHPQRARLVRPLIFGEGSAPLLTDDGEERSRPAAPLPAASSPSVSGASVSPLCGPRRPSLSPHGPDSGQEPREVSVSPPNPKPPADRLQEPGSRGSRSRSPQGEVEFRKQRPFGGSALTGAQPAPDAALMGGTGGARPAP